MTTVFNRRDIGFTVISRLEETFRDFLLDRLSKKYQDFKNGIPPAIVTKANEKSEILYWGDPSEFFENTDFPDLMETSVFKDNFKDFFPDTISKNDFTELMTSLYTLRCKIAHVKGFFTSIDLDKLNEQAKKLATYIDIDGNLIKLITEIEINPEKVAIKVPLDFNVDFLESNGIINNLPTPDYEYEGGFVGREDDIKEIIKYLQREKFPVVTITGAGGVGKTSLALKVIQEITQKPKSSKFDAIIWLSAKENKLSPFGIEDIEPTFKSFEDLLNTIIDVLGFGIEIKEGINTVEKKEETVQLLLEMTQSILIIVDNLETITDERIINFIIDAPEKAKFLITSRKGLGQVERRYELKQLKEKEAIYLFRQLAKDKQVNSLLQIDNETIKRYVNKVSNYPLAIKWVIGQVARGRDINKVINSIDDASGDISKFCFEQIFGMLYNNSKAILYALCCFEEPPTASLLKYVVEIDNQEFDDAIEELILVSLIIPEQFKNEQEEIGRKFYILPLTKGYVRQQLNQNGNLRESISVRIAEVESTITATEQAKREYRFSLHNLGAVTEEEKIAAIFTQTAFQKYQAGLYDEAVENYKKALEVAPRFSSIYRNWAVMESYENHLFEADQLMQKAADLNPEDPQIWLLWGNIKRKANKVTEADEKYEKAYKISPDNHILLNAYGQTRGRLGDYEMALKLLYEALKSDNAQSSRKHEIINRTSIAEALIAWSEFLFRDRNAEAAEKKLFDALEECKRILRIASTDPKSHGILSKTLYKLGKLYNKLGDKVKTKEYFNKCLKIKVKGFKVIRYQIKSAVELAKILFDEGDFETVKNVLTPYLQGYESIFRKHPEIITEINVILDKVGSQTKLVDGKIVHVNTQAEYVLIEKKDEPGINYIAGRQDFNPIMNSLNKTLQYMDVKFIPKTTKYMNKEKREAKSIIIIS
ncbi:MAG: ATP-binding protein [Bacteroidetes bacterium]|nr:ATP-binding protein [Bacteroidota bacterium]